MELALLCRLYSIKLTSTYEFYSSNIRKSRLLWQQYQRKLICAKFPSNLDYTVHKCIYRWYDNDVFECYDVSGDNIFPMLYTVHSYRASSNKFIREYSQTSCNSCEYLLSSFAPTHRIVEKFNSLPTNTITPKNKERSTIYRYLLYHTRIPWFLSALEKRRFRNFRLYLY